MALIQKTLRVLPLILAAVLTLDVQAANFVPLPWQRRVQSGAMAGQRKHTDWVRDQNGNYVDDELDAMLPVVGATADVFVQLNRCLEPNDIQMLLANTGVVPPGRIRHCGRLLAYVIVKDARVADLEALASDSQVAGVEMVRVDEIVLNISTRSVRVRDSVTYNTVNVEDAFPALDGSGVNVAILDTGVDDPGAGSSGTTHSGFLGAFVGGFNAREWDDTDMNGIDDSCEGLDAGVCEPANGSTNPDDDHSHGTHVAGIALGEGVDVGDCTVADDGSTPNDATGVAPGAGLVDVKVCSSGGSCSQDDAAIALDWLAGLVGTAPPGGWADAANISIGNNLAADGTATITQAMNAAVANGISIAVAMGNGGASGCVGDWAVSALAVTVGSDDDQFTVDRDDDVVSEFSSIGPSFGFVCEEETEVDCAGTPTTTVPDVAKLKPDLVAPGCSDNSWSPHACTNVGDGDGICSAQYNSTDGYWTETSSGTPFCGTSMAAPHVAGAMALIKEHTYDIPPGVIKDVLKISSYETPDMLADGPFCPEVDSRYHEQWGYGLLDVYNALVLLENGVTDISFTDCVGPHPDYPDQPRCELGSTGSSWLNKVDLVLADDDVREGEANCLTVYVENRGSTDASNVTVSAGVYHYTSGLGLHDSYDVGSKVISTLPAGETASVSFAFTPEAGDHQCIVATIDYWGDTDYTNNATQRNLDVAAASSPARKTFRIQNPTGEDATMRLVVRQSPPEPQWRVVLNPGDQFTMARDACPTIGSITMTPPQGTPVGTRKEFHIVQRATTPSHPTPMEVGGVTVEVVVTEPVAFAIDQAVSRMAHGEAGTFDIDLPISGAPASESRIGGPSRVVLTFNKAVQAADGTMDCSEVSLSNGSCSNVTIVNDNTVIIYLTGANANSCLNIAVNGITDTFGTPLVDDNDVNILVVGGDGNANGATDIGDLAAVNTFRLNALPVTDQNFRFDFNVNGVFDIGDLSFANFQRLAGASASCSFVPIVVSDLNAMASSVSLPTLPQAPNTGPIAISLTPGVELRGTLDQSTGEGVLFWPVRVDAPLLQSIGKDPIDAVFVGPFFTSGPDDFLIAFDLAFVDDADLGRIYIANNNKNFKEDIDILLTGVPGNAVAGQFFDIGLEDYNRLERDRLRDMMDEALSRLQAFVPSVPALDSSVLDAIQAMYDADPNTELILYFPDAPAGDQFRTSQLTGTDQLSLR